MRAIAALMPHKLSLLKLCCFCHILMGRVKFTRITRW